MRYHIPPRSTRRQSGSMLTKHEAAIAQVRLSTATDTLPLIWLKIHPLAGLRRTPKLRRMNTPIDPAPMPTAPGEPASALEAAFAGRATIGVPELSALIPMHRETIARHIAAGNLTGRLKGLGRTRRRRVFTIQDVVQFMRRMAEAPENCAETGQYFVDFHAGQGCRMNITRPVKRKRLG